MNTLDIIRQKELRARKLHEARLLMARLNQRANNA
jgi:hypothetical protein